MMLYSSPTGSLMQDESWKCLILCGEWRGGCAFCVCVCVCLSLSVCVCVCAFTCRWLCAAGYMCFSNKPCDGLSLIQRSSERHVFLLIHCVIYYGTHASVNYCSNSSLLFLPLSFCISKCGQRRVPANKLQGSLALQTEHTDIEIKFGAICNLV